MPRSRDLLMCIQHPILQKTTTFSSLIFSQEGHFIKNAHLMTKMEDILQKHVLFQNLYLFFFSFNLILYVPAYNFSVMSGTGLPGLNQY